MESGFRQWIEQFSEKQLPEIYALLDNYREKDIVILSLERKRINMHNITELPKMPTDIENRILQDELFYEGLVERDTTKLLKVPMSDIITEFLRIGNASWHYISIVINAVKESDSIYQYYELQSLEELKEELRETTGFEGEYRYVPASGTWVLEDGNRGIFIYDHNTWTVTYHYGEGMEKKESRISFELAVRSAKEYMKDFNIDTSKLTVIEKEDSWIEFNTIEFSVNEVEGDLLYYGNIRITLDDEGDLVELSDYIITGKTVTNTECISPRHALQVTQRAGLNEFDIEVTVLSVDKGYSLIKSTGYIIPTWKIAGEYETYGKVSEYSSEVSALDN